MPWAALIPLIVQYGLPFAEQVFQKVTAGGDVTQSDLDALKALAANNVQNQIAAAAQRAGLAANDPTILKLLAMVTPPTPAAPPAV